MSSVSPPAPPCQSWYVLLRPGLFLFLPLPSSRRFSSFLLDLSFASRMALGKLHSWEGGPEPGHCPPRATAVKRNSIARQTEAARSSIDGGGFIWSGLYAQCGSRRSCSGSSWVRFRVNRDKPKNIQNKNNATQSTSIGDGWVCRPGSGLLHIHTGPSRVE